MPDDDRTAEELIQSIEDRLVYIEKLLRLVPLTEDG